MYGIYKIQNGDTLEGLAKRYGVSPEILKNLMKRWQKPAAALPADTPLQTAG